jgi:hypothetical protein
VSIFDALFASLRPVVIKGKPGPTNGVSTTPTYSPTNTTVLAAPTYRDHLEDIYNTRLASDDRALIERLAITDPDLSSTISAYLSVSSTDPVFEVIGEDGEYDAAGHEQLLQVIDALTVRSDYSTGFKITPGLAQVADGLKYMMLMRGAGMAELVLDKARLPAEIRIIDTNAVAWKELGYPGQFKPIQKNKDGEEISLDLPTIFFRQFQQNPIKIYPRSHFTAAINAIAARETLINTIFSILKTTGVPRLDITIVEEVLMKQVPDAIKQDPVKLTEYRQQLLNNISASFANLTPQQNIIHSDSVTVQFLEQNGSRSGSEMQVKQVMDLFNYAAQAAMKTMSTVIGRGDTGVNTSSVESRMFATNCDKLNEVVADMLTQVLTFAMRLTGYSGKVLMYYPDVELRPATELEPQLMAKRSSYLEQLSLGLITDYEYHMEIFRRPPPAGAPALSGTGFMKAGTATPTAASPNQDPQGRSLTPAGGNGAARDNRSKPATNSFKLGQTAEDINGNLIVWTGAEWVAQDKFATEGS